MFPPVLVKRKSAGRIRERLGAPLIPFSRTAPDGARRGRPSFHACGLLYLTAHSAGYFAAMRTPITTLGMRITSMKRLFALALGLAAGLSLAQEPYPFVSTPIAQLNEPWALEFLPDGRILVTEKAGTIQLVTQDGEKTEVAGAPEVDYFFQGGLGDIALHPQFESNGTVYISYVEAGADDTRGAVVARGTLNLEAPAVENLEVIWRATPKMDGGLHFSHRILFDDEGYMYVSAGERNK